MRLPRAQTALVLALCALVASAQPDDLDPDPDTALRTGLARLALYRTLLDLEVRYLERTIPAAAFGPEAAFHLARCRLLAGEPAAALAALDRPLAPARADGELYSALVALVRRAAESALEPAAFDFAAFPALPESARLRLAAEHAFLAAAVGGHTAEGAALARDVEARAAREGLPLVAAVRRCLAYCALRAGDPAVGRRHLAPLLPLEPELRIQIEEFAGGEDGRVLATEIVCYAPDVLLAHAIEPLGRARAAEADPVTRARAALASGDMPDATGVDPASPWRIALTARALALAPEAALVDPLRADPVRAPLLEAARALEEVLGRADLALGLRQRALLLLRERGSVHADGSLLEPPLPPVAPGDPPRVRLATLAPARFVELAAQEVGELASCALDSADPATRARAIALYDALFAHARRANLWEFDRAFLARLARSFVEAGRYDALTGYLFRRPTLSELEVCAAAARTMARELEAFAALDRQAGSPRGPNGPVAIDLELLLFGAADPGAEYLPRPTPRVDLEGLPDAPLPATEDAARWTRDAAEEAVRWVTDPLVLGLALVAFAAWAVRTLRRRRILARYEF